MHGLPPPPSRCPYQGDNYQAQLVPLPWDVGLLFPSHHQRFVVRTFTFVDTDARQMLSGPVRLGAWPERGGGGAARQSPRSLCSQEGKNRAG